MLRHIHNSNLIESIDDPEEDAQSCEAWAYLIQHKKFNLDTIFETHRLITLNQLPATETGHMRKVDVWVGGRACPAPYLAAEMLNNWVLDMRAHWKTLNPKEMHIQFEKIHPFIDGNGRTGRMLMWQHERLLGQKPTLINYPDRLDYYRWFKA